MMKMLHEEKMLGTTVLKTWLSFLPPASKGKKGIGIPYNHNYINETQ